MIKTFFRRLTRDSVDTIMMVVFAALIIAEFAGTIEGTDTLRYFATIVFFWAIRFMIWHSILWDKVDKYVTDDFVRRNIFGLGSYDPRYGTTEYRNMKPNSFVIIDLVLKVIIVAFVTFVAVQIIFFN